MGHRHRSACPPHPFRDDLEAAGFTRPRRGNTYRNNGMGFEAAGRWACVHGVRRTRPGDLLSGQLGAPALWKRVADGSRARRVFDLPLHSLRGTEALDLLDDGEDAARPPLQAALAWALDTAHGAVPAGWRAPARAEVAALVPARALTVRCGRFARQGELDVGPGRLAVRFPILPRVPDDLPGPRARWLRRLLLDAHNRWRLVRVGFARQAGAVSAQAEVDLSGAPHAALEGLLDAALAALRHVVSWAVAPASFLVDTSTDCRALDARPARRSS